MSPPTPHPTLTLPFSDRAETPSLPPLSRYLLSLISIKRSNLCVSADVHTTHDLIQLAEDVGDSICVLKTHADIIDDFSKETIKALQEISNRKHFLLFEDRKFGDIGNTLQSQYTRGPLAIATWAHLTNAHLLPGPLIIPSLHLAALSTLTSLNQSVATTITTGTPRRSLESNPDLSPIPSTPTPTPKPPPPISTNPPHLLFSHHRHGQTASATTTISQHFEPTSPTHPPTLIKSLSESSDLTPTTLSHALQTLGPPPHARGLLLLAQMSSEGNLMTEEYTQACLSAARHTPDFVLGFVTQKSLNADPTDAFLSFAPGVTLPPASPTGGDEKSTGDGMGQRYRSPATVVGVDGIDVVIVGRGILGAEDRGREAERYRRAAWEAYEGRIGRRR